MSSDIDFLWQYPLWGELKSCLFPVGCVVYLYEVWHVISYSVGSCCFYFR